MTSRALTKRRRRDRSSSRGGRRHESSRDKQHRLLVDFLRGSSSAATVTTFTSFSDTAYHCPPLGTTTRPLLHCSPVPKTTPLRPRVVMSNQLPPIPTKSVASTSKAATASGQSSPAGSQTQLFAHDSGQRRSGSGGGGNARSSSAARNQQSSKPKHKHGKKFRPLDEDAEAELFSMQQVAQAITHT